MSVRWMAALLIVMVLVVPEVAAQNSLPDSPRSLQRKMRELRERIEKWEEEGRAVGHVIGKSLWEFRFGRTSWQPAQQTGSYVNKERKLDEALKLMDISFTPTLPDKLPVSHYGDALQSRVQAKQRQLTDAAPRWIRQGGSRQQLEGLLKEFERRMKIATQEWDIYCQRSEDAGRTWTQEQRTVAFSGNSHRPQLAVLGRELQFAGVLSSVQTVNTGHLPDGGLEPGIHCSATMRRANAQFDLIGSILYPGFHST